MSVFSVKTLECFVPSVSGFEGEWSQHHGYSCK